MKPYVLMALLAASPAVADCPTTADLATGIRVTENDGTFHIFRDLGNGIVEQTGTYPDGYSFRNLLARGVHVLQLADVEDGRVVSDSISNTAYPDRAIELPVPQVGMTWTVNTMVRGYGEIYAERQAQVWGEETPLTLGDCTLSALPGKISYVADDSDILETVYFLPQQGISLLMSYRETDGTLDRYTYVTIEAVQ